MQLKPRGSERVSILVHHEVTDTTGLSDDMIERYSKRLTSILDIHAQIIHRTVLYVPRPNAPWYTNSLHTAKRKRMTHCLSQSFLT